MRGLLHRVRRDEPRFGKALPAGVGRAPPLPALALAGIRRGLPLRTVHVLRLEHPLILDQTQNQLSEWYATALTEEANV